jgi:ATP-dependent DNA helicase RecQ
LIVATVAFGMGIDRSNIRFVLHTAMPKSVEHYQQETGRAGRDSLEAECVLLYSGQDFQTWNWIMEKSAQENDVGPDFLANAVKHLNDMDRYCRGGVCRHRSLVQYFNQTYDVANCAACDVCLGDVEQVPEAGTIAKKILSCVARTQERFGIGHVVGVLRGDNTERIRSLKHDELSTYGLLREFSKQHLRDWIYQLIGQGALMQEGVEYPILKLNPASWDVMRGKQEIRLVQPVSRGKGEKTKQSRADTESWEGVDRSLFEELRQWRAEKAKETQKPAYIIFSDNTLRELARIRPSTLEALRLIYGIGEQKLRELGQPVLELVIAYCQRTGMVMDAAERPRAAAPVPRTAMTPGKANAFALFRQGLVIEDVMHQTSRARSTVLDDLAQFIQIEKPESVAAWVEPPLYERIAQAARQHGTGRLKPIFIALDEKVSYEAIRLVIAHLTRVGAEEPRTE